MNYYKEIKNKILDNEAYERVKDYSKERHKVLTYFEIGRLLHEAGKHYGENIIKKYSEKLTNEFNGSYSERSLLKMRQFYIVFSNLKWMTMPAKSLNQQLLARLPLSADFKSENALNKGSFTIIPQNNNALSADFKTDNIQQHTLQYRLLTTSYLTWSHYTELISIKDTNKMLYYLKTSIEQKLDVRSLRAKIKSKEYERLNENTRNKLITHQELNIKDYVPNPILIRNTSNKDVINEKILHNLIMEDIASFMKELGDGYSFIDSEFRILLGETYNYIDFLFFNIDYNCYVVVELKITELKKEHIGQIQVYMNYIDNTLRRPNQDKTIGIIICKQNNEYIIKYCSDERIISREYKLI